MILKIIAIYMLIMNLCLYTNMCKHKENNMFIQSIMYFIPETILVMYILTA